MNRVMEAPHKGQLICFPTCQMPGPVYSQNQEVQLLSFLIRHLGISMREVWGFLGLGPVPSSLHFLLFLGNLIYSYGFRSYILVTPKFVSPSQISSLICLSSFPRLNSQLPALTCLKLNPGFPFSICPTLVLSHFASIHTWHHLPLSY